jgi:hypothetical protein
MVACSPMRATRLCTVNKLHSYVIVQRCASLFRRKVKQMSREFFRQGKRKYLARMKGPPFLDAAEKADCELSTTAISADAVGTAEKNIASRMWQ